MDQQNEGEVMDDRELLKLAAKAAGIGGAWEWPRGAKAPTYWRDADGRAWQPLTDDGDALRLAVDLAICIGPNFDNDRAVADGGEFSQVHAVEMFGGDKRAATRRAITRAAAELARAGAQKG